MSKKSNKSAEQTPEKDDVNQIGELYIDNDGLLRVRELEKE